MSAGVEGPAAGSGTAASVGVKVFSALSALLILSFFFLPDQAGRNLILYATALSAHALAAQRRAWQIAYGHPGGWVVLLLVLAPAASLGWSSGADADLVKDLLVAAYCLLAIYLGAASALETRPSLTDAAAALLVVAGNVAGGAAVVIWLGSSQAPGAFRLEGVWGLNNPVHASVLLLAVTLPVLSQLLGGRRTLLWLAALVVPIWFVMLAGARTAAAAYVVTVLVMAAMYRPKSVALVAAVAVLLAGAAVALLGDGITEEVWLSRGLSYRDAVWQQVWAAYRDCHPVIGCGIATALEVEVAGMPGTRAHSVYLAALYHQGLLGLALFVGALVFLLGRALAIRGRERDPPAGWAWMLLYVLLANVTSGDHVLVRATLFWPAFWLPVMILAARSTGSSPPART